MRSLFVTGTDTGVGKTTVATAILAAATRRGLRALACKPVETGCAMVGSILMPADGALLQAAAGADQPLDEVCPVRFAEPLAPAIAARRVGRALALAELAEPVRVLARREADLLIVESAGGWLVPLTSDATVADLAAALAMPLVIVARDGLGTINHTSMTVELARGHGLTICGVVLSAGDRVTSPDDVADNVRAIEGATGVRVLGHLPRLTELGLDDLAERAERHLDVDFILGDRPRRG